VKTLAANTDPRKPMPSAYQSRTMGAILNRIAIALDGDGSWIEPGSIDSSGLTVVASGMLFRVELDDAGIIDDADYQRHAQELIDRGQMSHDSYSRGLDFQDSYQEPEF
jgi:hypothetical protein